MLSREKGTSLLKIGPLKSRESAMRPKKTFRGSLKVFHFPRCKSGRGVFSGGWGGHMAFKNSGFFYEKMSALPSTDEALLTTKGKTPTTLARRVREVHNFGNHQTS